MLFANNEEKREKLLKLDPDAIKLIGYKEDINPEDIITAYESKDSETMKELYNKAKSQVRRRKLYEKLCEAYSEAYSKDSITNNEDYESR